MTRKLILSAVFAAISVLASAQYKISSVDSQHFSGYELKYVLEGENSTFVYGTFTTPKPYNMCFDRTLAVYQNDMKYKSRNSVNIPLYDEAEYLSARLNEAGDKINFVIEFEKFKASEPFDIVTKSNPEEGSWYLNAYGIRTEPVAIESFPDFDRFIDAYPVTMYGSYVEQGDHYNYYMRDNIYVSCECSAFAAELFEPAYFRFLIEINNDSDHGIRFDFDKVYVVGKKEVNGKIKENYLTKYTADSFEQYMADEDYYEAKSAVGNDMDQVGYILRQESYKTSNEWGKLGLQVLSDMAKESAEQSIKEYLAAHPKQRPGVLRSQSLNPGESIRGYIAFKRDKSDTFTIHVPLNGYDYYFVWK